MTEEKRNISKIEEEDDTRKPSEDIETDDE